MKKEDLNHLQNLHNLQSLSRYEHVSKEFLLEKYYRVVNFIDLLYDEKYNELIWYCKSNFRYIK